MSTPASRKLAGLRSKDVLRRARLSSAEDKQVKERASQRRAPPVRGNGGLRIGVKENRVTPTSAYGTSATFRGKGRMSGFSREADIRGLLSVLFYALRPSNE